MFYIVSPRDIVVARPRDLDDHVAWLLEHEMYEEALTEAEKGEKLLKLHNVAKIGQDYLNHLTQTGHFEEAAMHCRRVLGADKDLWERWVYFFFKSNQHKAIIHYIPTENPTLSRTIYEMVLNWFLNSDVAVFKRTVSQWPSKLYDIDAVIKAVEARLSAKPDDPLLLETLAELYTKAGMYGQAVEMHLRRGNPDVFNLIKAQNLFSAVQNRIVRLMEFRTPEAVALLVNNTDSIPIKQVVDQLQKHRGSSTRTLTASSRRTLNSAASTTKHRSSSTRNLNRQSCSRSSGNPTTTRPRRRSPCAASATSCRKWCTCSGASATTRRPFDSLSRS
eukprot:Opistho-1_new@41342